MVAGTLSLIIGYFVYGTGDEAHQIRFWAALLQNSVYFLLVVNAAMFFFCAVTLAMGGFQMAFRRVTEAISASVPVIGGITFVILVSLVAGHKHFIYEWLDKEMVA
ncbi:MAG TPA: quinol:cytochrome C oxidoreductase, partial [Chitinophagaceae bacterium]|nr:quinol:cytochrome C oxidoreductase [Chitinophagaceae bacterium]